jgi:hypothetical protein
MDLITTKNVAAMDRNGDKNVINTNHALIVLIRSAGIPPGDIVLKIVSHALTNG